MATQRLTLSALSAKTAGNKTTNGGRFLTKNLSKRQHLRLAAAVISTDEGKSSSSSSRQQGLVDGNAARARVAPLGQHEKRLKSTDATSISPYDSVPGKKETWTWRESDECGLLLF